MIRAVATGVPEGSVLARLGGFDGGYETLLPPVPLGHTVSATVGPGASDELVAALVRGGYRLAGEMPGAGPAVVDLVVPPAVRTANSDWWRELARRSDRIFDLRMGPVVAVLDDELAVHAAVFSR